MSKHGITASEADILRAVAAAATAGEALDAIPEGWYVSVITGELEAAASVVPPSQRQVGTFLYDVAIGSGCDSGHGATRLDALKDAAGFVLRRIRVVEQEPSPDAPAFHP